MSLDKNTLINRFKKWSYECLDLVKALEYNTETKVISHQLVKSCTSSYANYSAACRAKSKAAFINKLKIVEEELDESKLWLQTLHDRNANLDCKNQIREANELLSIIVASIKTIRKICNSLQRSPFGIIRNS